MTSAIRTALAAALGEEVRALRPHGGGVTDTAIATLADGREVFVKTAAGHPRGWASAEAAGLAWLAEPGALRLPQVRAVDDDHGLLVLECIRSAPAAADHDERLGRGLAAIHRAGAPAFGLDRDGFLAGIPQPRVTCATIVELWGTHRLAPLVRRLRDAGCLSTIIARGIDRVIADLPALVGPAEPPARLHGDLWGGNAITDERGAPVLIDPAAYGGHREIDLAMMQLFGGFGPRVFAAYAEAYPLADGHAARVPLWQLYPLLVHVALFGGGYVAQAEQAIARLRP